MIVSSKENMAPSPKDHFDLSKICSESFSAQKGASLTWRVFLACLITNSSTGFHASAHATLVSKPSTPGSSVLNSINNSNFLNEFSIKWFKTWQK